MSVEGRKKFEANVADRKIDLQIGSRTVWIDGRALEFSAEALSSSHLSLVVDGASYSVLVMAQDDGTYRVVVDGCEFDVRIKDERGLLLERFGINEAARSGVQVVRAPMPGLVLSVSVEPGQRVARGASLAVLEAMKMENELRAERDGVVKAVHIAPGDAVAKNDLLIEIE